MIFYFEGSGSGGLNHFHSLGFSIREPFPHGRNLAYMYILHTSSGKVRCQQVYGNFDGPSIHFTTAFFNIKESEGPFADISIKRKKIFLVCP